MATQTVATHTMVQAIATTLDSEMARDDRVVVIGEDVGKRGGVFLATEKLFDVQGAHGLQVRGDHLVGDRSPQAAHGQALLELLVTVRRAVGGPAATLPGRGDARGCCGEPVA